MANYVNHPKGMKLSDLDYEIMKALYKSCFLLSTHISLIVGENLNYINKRLRDLATSGYVMRKVLKANCPAANWLTKKGIKEVQLPMRNVRAPTLAHYEHSVGCADAYLFFCLLRKRKDGTIGRFLDFGSIITERDFLAVRELQQTGTKNNGQPIFAPVDQHIHRPDGYFCKKGNYYAIEFERTAKSTCRIVRDNVLENAKRFKKQFWFFETKAVYNMLLKIQQEIGTDKIQLFDIGKVREQLQRAISKLPAVISKKSGKPRQSAFGQMVDPLPLNRIPLLPSAFKAPVLEFRSKPTKLVHPNRNSAMTKPSLRLEKRRKG